MSKGFSILVSGNLTREHGTENFKCSVELMGLNVRIQVIHEDGRFRIGARDITLACEVAGYMILRQNLEGHPKLVFVGIPKIPLDWALTKLKN